MFAKNVLPYAKAYAALIGAVCTALLGVFTADTPVGQVLVVVSVLATALVTFRVPNLDPAAEHQGESVQPPEPPVDDSIVDDEPGEDPDPAVVDPALRRLQ